MINPDFHDKIESHLLMVASSALEAGKSSVIAIDAYKDLYNLVKHERRGLNSMLIMRGCIKLHKAMVFEMESIMDSYESAIKERMRVRELFDKSNKLIPVCKQLLLIANLHREKIYDHDKCSLIIADVTQRLLKKSPSLDLMSVDCIHLLIQCYQIGAISYSKAIKWDKAIQQYEVLHPLLAKTKGQDCQEYISVSI